MPQIITDYWPYACGVIGALWVVWTYFDTRRRKARESTAKPTVSATNGGIAGGRDVTIGGNATTRGTGVPPPP